jgi:mannose-6-phosphate isomerase-like protein (cupin superfamily)
MSNPNFIEVFPIATDLGPRTWGTETLLALVPGKYSVKRIEIAAGEKGGLQYHHLKDEVGVMIEGKMLIRIDDGTGNLIEREVGPGAVFRFTPKLAHQTEAITDVVYIEASTPHFNDRVRVDELFGEFDTGGLPSTTIDEVEIR